MRHQNASEFFAEAVNTHGEKYGTYLQQVYEQACDYVEVYETGTPDVEKAQDLLSQNPAYECYKHWLMVKQDFERSQLFGK